MRRREFLKTALAVLFCGPAVIAAKRPKPSPRAVIEHDAATWFNFGDPAKNDPHRLLKEYARRLNQTVPRTQEYEAARTYNHEIAIAA